MYNICGTADLIKLINKHSNEQNTCLKPNGNILIIFVVIYGYTKYIISLCEYSNNSTCLIKHLRKIFHQSLELNSEETISGFWNRYIIHNLVF